MRSRVLAARDGEKDEGKRYYQYRRRRVWADTAVGEPEPKAGWWGLVGLTHREGYWIGSERGVVSRAAWRSWNFPWETAS